MSMELVASSSTNSGGSFSSARANEISCFLPGGQAVAAFAALRLVAVGQLLDKRVGADQLGRADDALHIPRGSRSECCRQWCPRTGAAIAGRVPQLAVQPQLAVRLDIFAIDANLPARGLMNRHSRLTMVLLPLPVCPTSATVCPGWMVRLKSRAPLVLLRRQSPRGKIPMCPWISVQFSLFWGGRCRHPAR